MSDVPDEILREILSRLPVAPLLRFRCVSKSWKSLIEDQQFIKHHLTHSQKSNSNLNIIFNGFRHLLYSADFDLLNETNMATFKELSHPLTEATYCIPSILGSCNGLLVLRYVEDDITILWNSSVRRSHEIPSCGIEFSGDKDNQHLFHGFGYDVVSDDYKLVRIVQSYRKSKNDFNSEVKVYSLKSDSWRRIPDFPYYLTADGVLANDALHWIVSRKRKVLVAAFDLGTEEYRLLPLPKFAGDDDTCMHMIVLGGCLSLMHYTDDELGINVWVMKEYGVEESWSILFTFYVCDFPFMRPLAYSNSGRKVLLGLHNHGLAWYDIDKKSAEAVPMVEMPLENIDEMNTCLQSLVLLKNGTCDIDLVTKKKQERKDGGQGNRRDQQQTRLRYLKFVVAVCIVLGSYYFEFVYFFPIFLFIYLV